MPKPFQLKILRTVSFKLKLTLRKVKSSYKCKVENHNAILNFYRVGKT